MVIAGIPTAQLRHTRAAQELLEEGRQEGRQVGLEEGLQMGLAEGEALGKAIGEASVTVRQLNRLCGPLTTATIAQIQALPLKQLQDLTDALLDFTSPQDLADWLAAIRKD